MNRKDFIKGMQYLLNAYDKEMNATQIATWYDFFKDEKLDDFKQAIKHLIETNAFFPSIAQIKEEISKNYVSEEKAEDKWQEILKLIHKYGYYQSEKAINKLDEISKKTITQMGGFQKVCSSDEGVWQKKEFIELYNQNLNEKKDKIKRGEDICKLDAHGAIRKLTS